MLVIFKFYDIVILCLALGNMLPFSKYKKIYILLVLMVIA
jgi:hypothetical protein